MPNESKSVYVTLHKNFVREGISYMDRETGEQRTFNSVTMPKGTSIDGRDVSFFEFSPLYVNESRKGEDYRDIPPVLAQAMVDAAAILARTANPQAADFALDRAYFAQMLALCDGLSDGGFAKGYVQLQIDGANLRAAVRTRRMAKDADFLRNALVSGGTIGTDRVLAAFESAEALTALYANTWLSNAASAGAAAMSGGALTAFELLCDNALMDYIRAAKLRSFGAAHVSAYLAAMENETTAARMILTGRLAGLQPAVIRERLRETYA